MATLNTLRTRGGIIVSIVIGIALLAFLLGDLSSTNGIFSANKMKVGEIDGNKIGYMEYYDQVNYYTDIMQALAGGNPLSAEDQDEAKDVAWESMVTDYVFKPGFKKMGVSVSDTEQLDMIDGTYTSPVVSSLFVNQMTGIYDPSLVRNFVSNLDYDPRSAALWIYVKDQMDNQRRAAKYMTLIAKGMFVTDMESALGVERSNMINDISYIVKDYSSVADSSVVVSNAEIKAYYEKHRNMFKETASRDIEYVLFDVLPSTQDYADAEKAVYEIAAEFEESDNPMQFAMLNSQVQPDRMFYTEASMAPEFVSYAFGPQTGEIYGPVLNGLTHTMARVTDIRTTPDTVGAQHILLPMGTDMAKADSIMTLLRRGADFAAMANEFSIDEQANMMGGDIGKFPPEYMIDEFSGELVKHSVGDIFTVNTPAGLHIVKMTYKGKPAMKVQLAQITYRVEPSDITQQDIYARASDFVGKAVGSYDNFKKAASDEGLSPRAVRVRNTERNVSGLDNSRELVRWAFTGNNGAVSSIIEVGGDYVIAAITGVTNDGIASLKSVSPDIASILRNEKKGELVAGQMQGGSLSEIASRLGLIVDYATGIEYNMYSIEGIGMEPNLTGAVAAAKPNTLSRPVMGIAGVYVFEVTSREAIDNTTPESEKVRLEAISQYAVGERVTEAVYGISRIVDVRVKYF